MSSADQTVLTYIAETTIGVTPATPALKAIRYTGESLNFNIQNTQSAEIRPDRVEADLVQTSAAATGDINMELSFSTFDDFLEAALCGTWTSDVVKNGAVRRTFTIQKHFVDMTTPQFHNYKGCLIEGFNMKMEIGKIVSGAFNVMGFGNTVATAQITGATFPAGTTTVPMNAVTNVQDFTIDAVAYSGCISSLGVNVKNNARAIQCIGSLAARDMKLGTIEFTGDMVLYFNEGTNYANFVAGTEFAFSFKLEDDAGNSYTFDVPRAKFETGEVVAGGRNSDVMFSAKWRALYDGVTTKVISITRDAA